MKEENTMKQGRIVINHNICDHAPECGAIAVCPTGALYWDAEKEEIGYNADLCMDCAVCADSEEGCPVGAIKHAKNDNEYEALCKEVADETRRLEDLEVERYGAMPIPADSYLELSQIDELLNGNSDGRYMFIELFNDESIQCLLHSIRIEDAIKPFEPNMSLYKKLLVDLDRDRCDIQRIFGISVQTDLPCLAIFNGKNCVGKVTGYFADDQEKEFVSRISSIVRG